MWLLWIHMKLDYYVISKWNLAAAPLLNHDRHVSAVDSQLHEVSTAESQETQAQAYDEAVVEAECQISQSIADSPLMHAAILIGVTCGSRSTPVACTYSHPVQARDDAHAYEHARYTMMNML